MDNNDKREFGNIIRALFLNFDKEIVDGMVLGYWLGLSDLSLATVQQAAVQAIRECKSLPNVNALRDLAGVSVDKDAMAMLAWDDVMKANDQYGDWKSVDFEDKIINATLRNLGGWPAFIARMSGGEENIFARHDFLKTYRNLSQSPLRQDAVAALPGLSQTTVENGEVVAPTPKRIPCDPSRRGKVKLVEGEIKKLIEGDI